MDKIGTHPHGWTRYSTITSWNRYSTAAVGLGTHYLFLLGESNTFTLRTSVHYTVLFPFRRGLFTNSQYSFHSGEDSSQTLSTLSIQERTLYSTYGLTRHYLILFPSRRGLFTYYLMRYSSVCFPFRRGHSTYYTALQDSTQDSSIQGVGEGVFIIRPFNALYFPIQGRIIH
jgi:hypothetical protein